MKFQTIGLLGGGQLAQMLAAASKKAGLRSVVMAQQPDDPAVSVSERKYYGSPKKLEDLSALVQESDILLIENEFLDCSVLKKALDQKVNIHIVPSLSVIQSLQNKLSQKKIFSQIGLPTAPFKEIDLNSTLEFQLQKMLNENPEGIVLKWNQYGYDGKGNFFLRYGIQLNDAVEFCREAQSKNTGVYAESMVDFELEMAMVFIRTQKGEIKNYPLVISQQESGICRLVRGPAFGFGIPEEIEHQAIKIGHDISAALNIVGVFAIEFFYTRGGLVINEMAPRVHNSGHYTMTACDISQFDAHLLSAGGHSPDPRLKFKYFAMRNILGNSDAFVKNQPNEFPIIVDGGLEIYWYRKKEMRVGRKMGHINCVANSLHELNVKLELAEKYEAKILNGDWSFT